MVVDQAGLDFIKQFEGFSAEPYQDVVGKWTVGYGHLIKPNEDFSAGISLSQAETILYSDVEPVEQAVLDLAPHVSQNQLNALVSFGFNLGIGSLKTMMGHGFDQIPAQILRWDHAGGKQVGGLTRSRQAESALFVKP